MAICDNCGNEYESTMKIEMNGKTYEFDCFECAINSLAPHCSHCNTRIIGHGLQDGNFVYCCAHCARLEGRMTVRDNISTAAHQ